MNQRNRELIPSFSRPPSRVMIRKVARYEEDLLALTYESLSEFKLPVKDKTILLKPNLVGLDPQGVMNTHPAVIAATPVSIVAVIPCEKSLFPGEERHRRLHPAAAVRDAIDPQRHLDRGQRTQQHGFVQVAKVADPENFSAQLAQSAAQ